MEDTWLRPKCLCLLWTKESEVKAKGDERREQTGAESPAETVEGVIQGQQQGALLVKRSCGCL